MPCLQPDASARLRSRVKGHAAGGTFQGGTNESARTRAPPGLHMKAVRLLSGLKPAPMAAWWKSSKGCWSRGGQRLQAPCWPDREAHRTRSGRRSLNTSKAMAPLACAIRSLPPLPGCPTRFDVNGPSGQSRTIQNTEWRRALMALWMRGQWTLGGRRVQRWHHIAVVSRASVTLRTRRGPAAHTVENTPWPNTLPTPAGSSDRATRSLISRRRRSCSRQEFQR